MRAISKSAEPKSLMRHRAIPDSNYSGYTDKQTLRETLVREQRGLCCFCLSRICAGEPGTVPRMKIAHWHSQKLHEDEQLDYMNLLGACMGNEGNPPHLQHCDTRQGEKDIKWNPANPDHRIEERIRYRLADGTIMSEDNEFDTQINDVLNLNLPFLRTNRKYVLDSFQKSLGKKKTILRPEWERMLREWNGEAHHGDLEPFCQIVVCFIEKQIARAAV